MSNKLQLSFFLMKLLNEFKHQDVSNAVESQRNVDNQVLSGFNPSPGGARTPMGVINDAGLVEGDVEDDPDRNLAAKKTAG